MPSEPDVMPEPEQKPAEIETPTSSDEIEWELAHQLQRGWRVLKWIFTALVCVGFLLVIGQMYLFYNLFADIHPALGIGFVAVLTFALILLVVRPLASFLTTPVAAKAPPPPEQPTEPTQSEALDRLKYDVRYLKSLVRNPALLGEAHHVRDALEAADTLQKKLASDEISAPKDRLIALEAFEKDHIETRLEAIDRDVDKLIRTEAAAVGVATAVSMNGTVDAFIVLWRNANLVARIARMYFGRPHLGGSLLILRDVAAIMVLSRVLEDITDLTGEIMGGLLGRMGGIVAGPVMDGGINAMMTLKLGYLAKRRCRSFESWSLKQAGSISASALEGVKRESAGVISELIRRSGGLTKTVVEAGESAWQGSKSAWSHVQGWFGKGTGKADPV